MAREGTQPHDYVADHGYSIPDSMLQKAERLWREQPKDITVEIQGSYTNLKQNPAEKVLVIWKVSESQTLFGKWCVTGAMFQTLTTSLLRREYESGN